ncbi:hypothetical protein KKF32_00450 [Patescibacteria group bacterium]|nr:hypothetical protein [Patescibacteria group bacterium]
MKPFKLQNNLHYSLNRYLNSQNDELQLLKKITNGYQKLPHSLKNIATCRFTIKTTQFKTSAYRKTAYYKTLIALLKFIRKDLAPHLSYFFIHGSLATQDYIEGFSDLDTYLFIKKNICVNPKLLKEFKQKLQQGQKYLKEIDSNSHHNFLCCNEINLKYYCNAYMPISVFRNAKILFGPAKIVFHLRDSRDEYKENFLRFVKILSDKKRFNNKNIDIFTFKYFVAVLLLMPTLYLQAKGHIVYKKYSFDLFQHPFLNKLSLIRKKFGSKSIKELQNLLGKNYFEQSQKMLKKMVNDINDFHKKISYQNKPIPLPLSVYKKARTEIINHLKTKKDIVAIYEYGSTKAPGISDLDLIAVTHGDLKDSKPEDYIITKNKFNYAAKTAQGTLMVITKEHFKNIQIFDEVNLKKIYGENIIINKLSAKEKILREKASVIDWLPERLTRLVILLQNPKVDVQYTLRYLRSYAYTLEKISKALKDPYYKKFSEEIIKARSRWLKGKSTDLWYLIRKGIYFGYEALNSFIEQNFNKEKEYEGSLKLLPWQKIVFIKEQTKIDPDFAISFSDKNLAVVPVNAKIFQHFFTYSQQNNILTRQMRKNFKRDKKINIYLKDKDYKKFLNKKMALANDYATYLWKNGFKTGLYRFGFYYKPKSY